MMRPGEGRGNAAGAGQLRSRSLSVAVRAAQAVWALLFRSVSFRRTHANAGQAKAAIVQAARTADTGRSKKGRILPSDLISDVTKACSTMVPMTMPSTIAATG